ncbi:MAG: U32 family peptidase [Bacilli bacterium]|nr:U32 family peptidase [Bacilli bacterium]
MKQEKNKPLLIAEIIDLDLINYKNLDGFVMPIKGLASYNAKFDLNDAQIVSNYCKSKNILLIAKIDKIFMEDEINDLYKSLDYLRSLDIDYYMYTDVAVLSYFSKHNLLNKLIYTSSKLIASFNEAKYYTDQGININPSSEISLDEIKKICSLDCVCLTVYGYLDIFYSKRKLISLYGDHLHKSLNPKGSYKIIEESRDDENIILENENGTFIFSSFIYLLYRELSFVNPKFIKINSFNLNKKDLFKIIDIYKDAIDNGISGEGYNELLDINGNVDSGFLYKKAGILNEK